MSMVGYVFKKPFFYEAKGQEIELLQLLVKPPTAKVANLCATLKVEFNRCMMKSQEGVIDNLSAEQIRELQAESQKIRESREEEVVDDGGVSEKEVVQILAVGLADLPVMLSTLRKILLTPGQASFEDGVDITLTNASFDEIPFNELNGLLVFYISNFIEASA